MSELRQRHLFLQRMSRAVRQAGVVARELQGKVENVGKEIEVMEGDTENVVLGRKAKTIVDEMVQEIILLAALDLFNPETIYLDAEEDTSLVKLFPNKTANRSLVIDPVDGTLEYASGKDSYSICVGLVEEEEMVSALVYFPARDRAYFLDKHGHACQAENVYRHGLKQSEIIKIPPVVRERIFKNNRVAKSIVDCIAQKGYEVFETDSATCVTWPDAILKFLSGEARAFVVHTPQMRDVLLGAILAGSEKGYALDWTGQRLVWPRSGRIDRAIFGVGKPPRNLFDCFSNQYSRSTYPNVKA